MFEKSLRRDQENIPVGKRQYFSSQVQPQRRDIRLAENRVLKETQQNLKSNGLLFKPQRLSQEHSTLSNTSGQYEKISGNQFAPKVTDKEQKIPLKDVTSPTSSVGVSDISYRIVNEILNAQHGNRNQLKLKAGSRMMERTKSPRVLAQTSCDNLTDAIRGVKAALEDNEELNNIDGKINEAKAKLEDKRKALETSRRRYEEETATLEQREKTLNKEHNRLKAKLEKSGVKIKTKEKPNLSTDKEKLKHLRGELQNHENELTRLNKILQKQETEKSFIEKNINEDFEKQIEDLEEAMLSIEEQKLEIYAKLNEAILSHNETLEQKAMMKEDLGGRLIQRADLVAQREDLEQAMENFKHNNAAETEFYFIESKVNQELGALETALYDLYVQRDNLKKQLKNQEHRDNKSDGVLNLERMKKDWFELCEIEEILSNKAEEVGLSGIDVIYSKILGQYGVHIEKNKIWEYMLDIAEETSEDEPEDSVRIRLKGKIREEAIENWKDHERERLDEILIQAEQKEFISMYKKFCEKMKDYDEDVAEERRGNEKLHETADQPEEELKKIEKEIQEKETRKEELESELDKRREKLESAVISETENAFQAYLQDQASTFETIKAKHGIEAAENMKRQYHREFSQIAQNDLLDKLNHYRNLQDDIKYLEQTIKNNTTTVDAKILPELQSLLPSLEEDTILVTALKQQQIHLLETEDEVAEQLNSVFENRAEKIRLSHQQFDENQPIPPNETQEAKNSIERKISFIREEITKVENHMIEVDKLATEGHSKDRCLQSELKGVDKELNELLTVKKSSLHELQLQIGILDKELKELEKSIEQLEMQKLGLEQQFIEQNYLNDELAHQGHTPKSTLHKRSSKTLNFDLKENTSVERQPDTIHAEKERKDKSRMTQSLKNNMIKGLMEMDLSSTKNASRSPMERVSPGPVTQKNKPKRDFFDNLNILSQQELSTEKGLMNTWTCFSPPGSVLLGGISQKIQEKLNDSKEKTRERKSHGHRDDLLLFRSQQNRPVQRQNTTSDSVDRGNTVNLDTRTNSLPQSFNPNIRKSEEGMLLNQTISPKGPEILGRAPSANQTRESYNEETLQKSYMTYFDKPKNSGSSEGLNVSSPKALNLHINSLISQAGLQNGTQNYQSAKEPEKPLSEVQLRYREFIRQSGDLPRGDLLRENFTTEELFPKHREEIGEGERSKTRVSRGNKPSLIDKSLVLNKIGDESGIARRIDPSPMFKNREESSNFLRQSKDLNDAVNKKKPHSLQEIIGEIRRGRKEMEARKDNQDDENRSKSIDIQQGKKEQKMTGHTGEKLSFRDRAEGSHGKLELSDTKSGMHPIRMLVSPSAKTPSGLSESKEFQDLKSKINDQSVQETLFFDMIKPLLQGSFLYKKFANAQSLKRAAFDPLMADVYPVEACGYGIRSIKLHPNLDRIEIKHTYKSGVEITLPLERILRPMVPQITMDVLRIQKKIVSSGQTEEEIPELFADVNTQAILAKRGVNNLNNGIEKYLSCSYYPFSLLLDKNGKAEFVASSYSVFKEWINGINMLLRYKKQLPQLRQKLKKS